MRRLHYIEAEKALLCAVMVGGDDVLDRLTLDARDFYDLKNRELFGAMRRLRDQSKPSGDSELLEVELGEKLSATGGIAYMTELAMGGGLPDNVEHYQSLVRKSALTRATLVTLSELKSTDLEGYELVGRVLEMTSDLARATDDPTVTIGEAAKDAYERVADLWSQDQSGPRTWGIPTGFDVIDQVLGGLQVGVVTIVAGRPSSGKSALARSFADNANLLGDHIGVHVFTPEDSINTYALRSLSDRSNVSLEKLRSSKIDRAGLDDVHKAASYFWRRSNWIIDDSSGIGSADIALRVRKHRRSNETKLVIVDYAQLLREKNAPLHDRRIQVELAAENLVHLARSENVAVLLLSQLSRECERRPDKRPMLSDLRESGALEQVAEAVMFVYRDEIYNPNTDKTGITEILIRKNKNGRTGMVELAWDAKTATHRPLSRQPDRYDDEDRRPSW